MRAQAIRAGALLALATACGIGHDFAGSGTFPHDPALGALLLVDSPLRDHFHFPSEGRDAAIVAVWHGAGPGLDHRWQEPETSAFEVPYDDPGAARPLSLPFTVPPPPRAWRFPREQEFHPGVSQQRRGAVYGVDADPSTPEWDVHVYDGDRWHQLAGPPGLPLSDVGTLVAYAPDAVLVARKPRFDVIQDPMARWDGQRWTTLDAPPHLRTVVPGPEGAAGTRIVYATADEIPFHGPLCVDLWPHGARAPLGEPVCSRLRGQLDYPALNGTVDDFVLLADTSALDVNGNAGVLRFVGGELVPLRGAPPDSRIGASDGATVPIPPRLVIHEGEVLAYNHLFRPIQVECEIDRRDDPSSDCVQRELFVARTGIGAGGSRMTEQIGDTVAGERRILVRFQPMPAEPEAPTAALPPMIDQIGSAHLALTVVLPEGADPRSFDVDLETVDPADEEHLTWVRDGATLLIDGRPGTELRVHLDGADATPPFFAREDAANLPFVHQDRAERRTWIARGVRALPLGEPFDAFAPWAAAPIGGSVILQDGRGTWWNVHRPPHAARPSIRPLPTEGSGQDEGDEWFASTPRFGPDGRHGLLFGAMRLGLFDAVDNVWIGEIDLGVHTGPPPIRDAIAFAWDAPCLVAPTASRTAAGASRAAVWCWESGAVVEALRLTSNGQFEALAADGRALARAEGVQTAVYDLATGTRRVSALPPPADPGLGTAGRYLFGPRLAVLQRAVPWGSDALHVEHGGGVVEVTSHARDAVWAGGRLYAIRIVGAGAALIAWDPETGLTDTIPQVAHVRPPLIVAGDAIVAFEQGDDLAHVFDGATGARRATFRLWDDRPSDPKRVEVANGPWGAAINDLCPVDSECAVAWVAPDGAVERLDRLTAHPFGLTADRAAQLTRQDSRHALEIDGDSGRYQAFNSDQASFARWGLHELHRTAAGLRAPCALYVLNDDLVCAW